MVELLKGKRIGLTTKICTRCLEELLVTEFTPRKASKDGLHQRCKKCRAAYYKIYESENKVRFRERRRKSQNKRYWKDPEQSAKDARDRRRKLRLEVLDVYGNACQCCGEKEESFLTIDHIHGNGNIHRREVGNNSSSVYYAIKREQFPKDKYQILCFNCNRSKFVLGICAHNMKKELRIGLDIDGCLACFSAGVLKRARQLGLEAHFPATCEEVDCWDMSDEFGQVMKDAWTDEQFWLDLPVLKGALPLPFIPYVYITSRRVPSYVTACWLLSNGFPPAQVITVSHPKEKLEHVRRLGLDLYVDDLHTTVRELCEAGITALLMEAPYQVGHRSECEGLPTIKSLSEVLNYV